MNLIFLRLNQLNIWRLIELLLYPLFLAFKSPLAWYKALREAKILLDGRWSSFMGFNPQNALNSFFYRAQWLNVDRYGRLGVSDEVSMGHYQLKNWFHLSNLSSYIYSHAGGVCTLVGTLMWAVSHIVWFDGNNDLWKLAIVVALTLSTTAYSMAFARQNYNILGWLFLPMVLFSTYNELWMLALLGWIGVSLMSITVMILNIPIIIAYAFVSGAVEAILVLIPSIFLLGLHLRLVLTEKKDRFSGLFAMAKLIGLTKKQVRYKRHSMRLGLSTVYLSGIYSLALTLLWWNSDHFPILPAVSLLVFIVNQRFARIADEQSVVMLFVSTTTAYMLSQPIDIYGFIIFWLIVSPLPKLIGVGGQFIEGPTRVVVYSPFDHSEIENAFDKFFEKVPAKSKILFAFNEPKGCYENLFDGYRLIIELPMYVCSKNKILAFPNWYSVADTNYIGAPSIWGRTIEGVTENLELWNAKYCVIYQDNTKRIDDKWLDKFELISAFDWEGVGSLFGETPVWPKSKVPPKFFLLKLR